MKLNDCQKDIVEKIKNREITDILSFVKYYNLGYEISADKEFVQSRFEELYKDKTYICDSRGSIGRNQTIVKEIDRTTVEATACLSFAGSNIQFTRNNYSYVYNYYKKIYSTEAIDEIISFIAIWHYLKEQALIIELPKSCSEEDMALFLRKKGKKITHKVIEQNEPKISYSDTTVYSTEFLDYEFTFDDENFEILAPFFEKKIYPAPELNTFIQKGFNTREELNNRYNLRIALAGVIIAIITSGASIIMSAMDRGYYQELENINKTLQEQLSSIENQLDALSDKKYFDSEMLDKLDLLIENQILNPMPSNSNEPVN